MSLSRRNPKRDANEKAIVAALRAVGLEVTQISGKGAPDLLVRCNCPGRPHLWAFEVKTGAGKRTAAQESSRWPIVRTPEDAMKCISALFGYWDGR